MEPPSAPATKLPLSRRVFVQAGAATLLSAASYGRVWGANERVGVGFIGYGLIGKRHVLDFQEQPDVDFLGVAETHRGRLEEATASMGTSAKGYPHFRKLLDTPPARPLVTLTPAPRPA